MSLNLRTVPLNLYFLKNKPDLNLVWFRLNQKSKHIFVELSLFRWRYATGSWDVWVYVLPDPSHHSSCQYSLGQDVYVRFVLHTLPPAYSSSSSYCSLSLITSLWLHSRSGKDVFLVVLSMSNPIDLSEKCSSRIRKVFAIFWRAHI